MFENKMYKILLTLCILPLLVCGCMANDNAMLEKSFYTMIDYNDKANIAFDNRNYSNAIKYADSGLDYLENSDNLIYLTRTRQSKTRTLKTSKLLELGFIV